MKTFDLSLYLVLDRTFAGQRHGRDREAGGGRRGDHGAVARQARLDGRLVETGLALKEALAGSGALLVVNDDVEAAVAIGADGLHIGQEDVDAPLARAMIGPDMILGLSVETEALAAGVDPAIVDYAGVGPVFATPTKPDHKQPVGFDGLARIVAASPVPAVAIGGLKAEHVSGVLTPAPRPRGRLGHLRPVRSAPRGRGDRVHRRARQQKRTTEIYLEALPESGR